VENKTITIREMDEQVRTAISQARQQLKTDKESLASLDELTRLWNDLCYRLVMCYAGLSLMRLVGEDNARSILQLAHRIIPLKGRSQLPTWFVKSLISHLN
jgi:hypothetical protein